MYSAVYIDFSVATDNNSTRLRARKRSRLWLRKVPCTPRNTVGAGVPSKPRSSQSRSGVFLQMTGRTQTPSSSPRFRVANSVYFVLFFSNHQYTGRYKVSESESQGKCTTLPRKPRYNQHLRSSVMPDLPNFLSYKRFNRSLYNCEAG